MLRMMMGTNNSGINTDLRTLLLTKAGTFSSHLRWTTNTRSRSAPLPPSHKWTPTSRSTRCPGPSQRKNWSGRNYPSDHPLVIIHCDHPLMIIHCDHPLVIIQAATQREPDEGSGWSWLQHCGRRGRRGNLHLLHPCRRARRCVWTGWSLNLLIE